MSKVLRRKHVVKEMMDDNLDLPTESQKIVRVICSRGNNLHEVEDANLPFESFLVSMPKKYRNTIWVKRGDYLLVDPIDEGGKVRAEICKVLSQAHVKEFTKAGVWPKRFANQRSYGDDSTDDDNDENVADMEHDGESSINNLIVRNNNRSYMQYNDDLHEETESSEDETSDEETSETD